jgi:hypothetical protein
MDSVDEDKNLSPTVEDRKTEQGVKFLEAELGKWKRRALAFQEGYRDKAFEVTSLEIQLLDLRAHGVDKVTASVNDSLRTKLLATAIQRNELKEALKLAAPHVCSNLCPSVKRTGEEWTHVETCQAITAALDSGLESAKRPISTRKDDGPASQSNSVESV